MQSNKQVSFFSGKNLVALLVIVVLGAGLLVFAALNRGATLTPEELAQLTETAQATAAPQSAEAKRKTAPLTLSDIDAISGATATSQAVVDAINAAWAAHEQAREEDKGLAFTGEAQGYAGPVWVKVVFDGNEISALTIGDDRFQETEGYGAQALEKAFRAQFTGESPEDGESGPAAFVRVSVKGRSYTVQKLGEERDLTIDQGNGVVNVLHLLPNGFYMDHSTCDNQLCVGMGTVTVDNYARRVMGPYVICLPNQVEVELIVLEPTPADMPDA